jgi:phosphoribosylaminoimidazolecarboxamide formyltransferase / IMP cyclohydrolase
MPTALLSSYQKDEHLCHFAVQLVQLGWTLLASSGTKKFLDTHKVPSADIGDIVGPPILGHRVVTLDRKIYAAILARSNNPADMLELQRIGMEPINLVCVSLYPLVDELAKPDCTYESVVDMIDIGGPTLLRAAAKSGCYVVSSPTQFGRVLQTIGTSSDSNPFRQAKFMRQFLAGLAAEAELKVAKYTALSGAFYKSVADGDFPHKWHRRRRKIV